MDEPNPGVDSAALRPLAVGNEGGRDLAKPGQSVLELPSLATPIAGEDFGDGS